jgi:hypothetical protein
MFIEVSRFAEGPTLESFFSGVGAQLVCQAGIVFLPQKERCGCHRKSIPSNYSGPSQSKGYAMACVGRGSPRRASRSRCVFGANHP